MSRFITCFLASFLLTLPVLAAKYEIDPKHSTIGFKIRHLTIANVYGKFGEFGGTFEFDPANIPASKVEASVKVASIDTQEKERDDHLRAPDFFDATKFPAMTFKSKSVKVTGEGTFAVEGDITIRDVTKPVTLEVEYSGSVKDPWGNDKSGFVATAKLNRKDFGMTWSKLLETGGLVVGEEVHITLEVEGKKIG